MRKVVVDKIASVAVAAELGREIRVSPDIPCEEGVLIAAEVLNNKSRYNKLELISGRMAQIKRGDVIVGALGHRKALFGYSGTLPEKLEPGDVLQLLNLGGVLGDCDSMNPNHGRALRLQGSGRGTELSIPWRAHRRARPGFRPARERAGGPRSGRHPRRGIRGHLHELRQDGGRSARW